MADLLSYSSQYLYSIAQTVAQLGGNTGNPTSDTCCQNVVTAINGVASAIAAAQPQPPSTGGAPAPVDLSGIVAALGQLVTAAGAWLGAWQTGVAGISGAIESVVAAISKSTGTDVSGLVKALQDIFTTIDVPLPVLEQLASEGWITGETVQLAGAGAFGSSLILVAKDYVVQFITWLIKWVENPHGSTFAPVFKVEDSIGNFLSGLVDLGLDAAAVPFYPVVKGGLDGVALQLVPTGAISLGDAGVNEDLLVTKTLTPALILNVVALVAGYWGWNTSHQLTKFVDIATGVLGLEEMKEFTVGARMAAGPVAEARMQAAKLYRQALIGATSAASLEARGILDDTSATAIMQFNGLSDSLIAVEKAGAYHGMQARQLIRLIETGLFSDTDLTDELTFSGMRQVSQHRTLLAAPYLATSTQRSALRSAIEAAYEAGLYSDSDLTAQLDSAEHNTDRDSLALTAGKLKKLTANTKELEAAYTTLATAAVIDEATYQQMLEAIGIQEDVISAKLAIVDAKLKATLKKQADAAARSLERSTEAKARQAAVQNFLAGNGDLATLTTSLLLTGLTAAQAASWADLAQLRQTGSLRWIYGVQKSPSEAALLRERVSALNDQRKRVQITGDQYVNSIQALGIPPRVANALLAAANAMITPKASAIVTPVSTN